MPSVEVRLILFAMLFVIWFGFRIGLFKKLKEHRQKKQQAALEQQQRQERKAQLEDVRQRQEQLRKRTSEILVRAAPGMAQKSVAVAGHDVWYLEGGPATGATVLLLHGFAGDKENWAGVGKRLIEGGFHVIAPDLPGFGQNEKDAKLSYDVTSQAKRIRAFAKRLGLENIHVAGCSVGGTIAAAYAYAVPQGTLSLTLIEPFGVRVPYESELDQLLAQDRNPMVVATPQAYENLLSFLYTKIPQTPPALNKLRAERQAKNRVFYLKVWQEVRTGERANLLDLLLPEIKIRTLAICGGKSKVIHAATAEVIRAMMPDLAQVVVLADCGHFPMVERPEETAEYLLRFLGPAAS